jgi:hypothetical protein
MSQLSSSDSIFDEPYSDAKWRCDISCTLFSVSKVDVRSSIVLVWLRLKSEISFFKGDSSMRSGLCLVVMLSVRATGSSLS